MSGRRARRQSGKMKKEDPDKLVSPLLLWGIRGAALGLLVMVSLVWNVISTGPFMFEVLAAFSLSVLPVRALVNRKKYGLGLLFLIAVGTASLLLSMNLTGREIGYVNFVFLIYSVLSSTLFLPEIARRSRQLQPLQVAVPEPAQAPLLD